MADYALEPFKWGSSGLGSPGGVVTYTFSTTYYAGQEYMFDAALTANYQNEVRRAFERWEQVARIDFVEVAGGVGADLRLGFDYIDGRGNVVGEAYTSYDPSTGIVLNAEIRFETNEGWTIVDNRIVTGSGASFYAIAVHEIGHTMGLGHYSAGLAIMNPVISVADLTPSDIHGAQAIYGSPSVFSAASFVSSPFGSASGGWSNNDSYPRVLGDINGDNRADIIGFGAAGTYVTLALPGGGFSQMYLASNGFGSATQAGGWSSDDRYHRELADINGDGLADIVGFGAAGTYVSLATIGGVFGPTTLASSNFGFATIAGGWSSQEVYARQLADINGDGRADIVGFGAAGTYASLALSAGGFGPMVQATTTFGTSQQAGGWSSDTIYHREMADVNGDGRSDIVGFGAAGVYVSLSTGGTSFAASYLALNAFGTASGWRQDTTPRHLADVNDDGYADIIGFGDSLVFVAMGRADGMFDSPSIDIAGFGRSAQSGGWLDDNRYPRLLGDIDGNGSADIVGFHDSGLFLGISELG